MLECKQKNSVKKIKTIEAEKSMTTQSTTCSSAKTETFASSVSLKCGKYRLLD